MSEKGMRGRMKKVMKEKWGKRGDEGKVELLFYRSKRFAKVCVGLEIFKCLDLSICKRLRGCQTSEYSFVKVCNCLQNLSVLADFSFRPSF